MRIFSRRQQGFCPKTGKSVGSKSSKTWLRWLFPITGLAALVWFLIRVIPKPTRVTYPCQKVAFPIASSFVAYLLGGACTIVAFRKAKKRLQQSRYILAGFCVAVGVGCAWLAISINSSWGWAAPFVPTDPCNSPMGVAKGINSGRVVWIHDPNATDWNGSTGYYWDDTHTDQSTVDAMLSTAIRGLTEEATDEGAWDALFRHFNHAHDNDDIGYSSGEKIVIKPNHVDHRYHERANNLADTTPHTVLAVMRQLVYKAGVNEADITISDPSRYLADKTYNKCYAEFPNAVYEETNYYIYEAGHALYGTEGRVAAVSSDDYLIYYSDDSNLDPSDPNDHRDKLPMSFVNASYVINLAGLKGHNGVGATLCAKNWYGCFGGRNPHYIHHNTLPNENPSMNQYRALVDLIGHEHLGGKTVLYMIDGLWGTKWHNSVPQVWSMSPFNSDYTSSLFVSQDPVAIDSVGLDFLYTQWASAWDSERGLSGGLDDHLHEAALANDPCSGTFYDPHRPIGDPGATRLESLGVHEHWNNATDKQYTRNLGSGDGIELVTAAELSCSGEIDGDVNGDCQVNFEDMSVIAVNWLEAEDEPRYGDLYDDGVIDFMDFSKMAADWCNCNIVPASACSCP